MLSFNSFNLLDKNIGKSGINTVDNKGYPNVERLQPENEAEEVMRNLLKEQFNSEKIA